MQATSISTQITQNQENKINTAAEALGEDPKWLTTLYNLNLLNIKETLKEYEYVETLPIFSVLAGVSPDAESGLTIEEILNKETYKSYTSLLFPISLTSKQSLSKQEIFYLGNAPASKESLERAVQLLVEDLGFSQVTESDTFVKSDSFFEKIDKWAFERNPYDDLISKALLSMIHQGLRKRAENLLGELEAVIDQYREKGADRLITTWKNNVYEENTSVLKV